MADIARDVPVPGRAAVPAVLRPAAGACGVILMHGSGGGMDSGRLPLYTDALADAGFSVLRFTIKPPSMPTRIKCCQAVLDTAAEVFPEAEHVKRWFLGGHSMGARVASQCASDNADAVPGVIFSSYPLHPPGEQDKLRDEPLASLQLPILFVRGTRDQFCDDGPWEEVRPRLTSPDITVHTVEGGDHGLKVKGGKAADEEAMDAACAAIIGFLHRVAGTTEEAADEADGMAEEAAEEEEAEAEVEEEEKPAEEANGTAGKAGASKKRASRAAKPKPAKQSATKEPKKSARSRGVTKPATPGKKAAPAKNKAASKPAAKSATPAKRKAAAKPAAAGKAKAASKPAPKAATPAKRKAAAKPAEAKATPKAATGKRKRSAQAPKEKASVPKAEQKAGKAKPAAAKASKAKGSASSKATGPTTKRAKRN